MDTLTGLLEAPRARSAFLLRSILDPPWSLSVQDEAPLTLVAVMSGSAELVGDSSDAISLRPGDIALIRGPQHYIIADAPDTLPQVVIHPGQRCTTVDGADLAEAMRLGVRTWGNASEGSTVLLTGTYETATAVSQPLLNALPRFLVLPADQWDSPLLSLMAEEIVQDGMGQEVILDRLLDLLLIDVVRRWFARPEAKPPAWYVAQSDPEIGTALRMLHNNPEKAWTVANLASEVGLSRASFARKFHELVGEPPISFLTTWRLAMAADLLDTSGVTIGQVASQVGYGSPYALSTAFKREHGLSPRAYREARLRK